MENLRGKNRTSKFDDEIVELAVGNLETGSATISTTNHNDNHSNSINSRCSTCCGTRTRPTTTSSIITSSTDDGTNSGSTRMDVLETQRFLPITHLHFDFGQQDEYPAKDKGKASRIDQIAWVKAKDEQFKGASREGDRERKCGGKTWQIIASTCASLFCVPFGIAFGWPSPTNPILLQPNSTIPITLDQSAMIAGFLMIGNTVGSPFTGPGKLPCKHALIGGATVMAIGWLIMWHAANIYCLLASRFLVGLGHAFGLGYLRQFIRDMTEAPLSGHLIKALTLWMVFGVILAVTYGNYVDFVTFGCITVVLTIVVLFVAVCLPLTPRELVQRKRIRDAVTLVKFLKPEIDAEREINDIYRTINDKSKPKGGLKVLLSNSDSRARFAIFSLLIFFQQFTGLPATIIYSKITLLEAGYAENSAIYLSIVYCAIFLISNLSALYAIIDKTDMSKKYTLLLSTVLVLCANSLLTCITYFMRGAQAQYAFFPVFSFFIIAHTLGLGNMPVTLINDYFEPHQRHLCTNYFVMVHSMCGLVVTKLYQTLLGIFGLYASFLMCSTISAVCTLFIVIFVPKSVKV